LAHRTPDRPPSDERLTVTGWLGPARTGSLDAMDDTTVADADETTAHTDDLLDDELLVEEISIDGMCGVY
jgi:mycofactocin precursor